MKPGSEGRRILPVFFSALLMFWVGFSPAQASIARAPLAPEPPKIRVRLKDSVPAVRVSGLDMVLRSPQRSVQFAGQATWDLDCRSGKIRINLGSRERRSQFVLPEPVSIAAATALKWEERPVREVIKLFTAPSGHGCQVVNELDLEDYLVGVVNGEFSSKWNEESISAQVIAARTYAWHQASQARRRLWHYDVEAGTGDQVYAGAESEDSRARSLVERTRGQVLLAKRADSKTSNNARHLMPIKAFYHSTCGGITDWPVRIFGERTLGVQGGVGCPYCVSSPRYRWTLELSRRDLEGLVGFSVQGLRVVSRWESGRVKEIEFQGMSRGIAVQKKMAAPVLRSRMGPEKLRSTAFEIRAGARAGTFVFEGRGNGHGVGMCQWGAKEMGEKGASYLKILAHYYPASSLQRLW
ncbi:MAG: SpoIID/LytB domain-containing protein [Oligoflexia bacterium]